MKHVTSALIMALSLTLLAVPTMADPQIDGPDALYLNGAKDTPMMGEFRIYDPEAPVLLKKSEISVSDSKILKVFQINRNSYENETIGAEEISSAAVTNVYITPGKKGVATLNAKVGDETLTKVITVYPYTCPVKVFSIKGINGGKNMASKFKKTGDYTEKALKKSVSGGKFTVQAASGWYITNMSSFVSGTYAFHTGESYFYTDQTTKATVRNFTTIKKNTPYTFSVTLKNVKTGGEVTLFYGMYMGEA